MAELLEELEAEREHANAEAERHRRKRDELNEKTREWAERRDSLNAQVRQLVEEALLHRERRDALNVEVRNVKEERDKWNRKVSELTERVSELRRAKLPKGGQTLNRLKRELKSLEFKQMTTVLTVDKERGIIEELARIQNEIKVLERALEENEEFRAAMKELKEAREKAESLHKRVGELAEKAQAEHDAMVSLYDESDALRREADLAQEEFIKTKMTADEEHRRHIEQIRQVHDYDKLIHGLQKKARGYEIVDEVQAKKQAELIFEKFKKGEKLSTEDLMTLQKSGYL